MDELREIFLKWSKVALSLSMLAGLFLIVLGPRFIGWWIDPSFEQPSGEVLQILMVSSFLFLPVRGVALPILMGLGKPKAPTIAFVAAGLLNLALSIAAGAPVWPGRGRARHGDSERALRDLCADRRVPRARCLACEVSRVCDPARHARRAPDSGAALLVQVGLQVDTLLELVAAGSAAVTVFAVIWIFFVYRGDPYVDLRGHVGRFRAWSRA